MLLADLDLCSEISQDILLLLSLRPIDVTDLQSISYDMKN